MKTIIVYTLIALSSFSAMAENSRSPAVLDNNCNLDIPTADKGPEQVQKELCKEVRKCMASAEDEDMAELKALEEVACNSKLTAINTKTPTLTADKNFDGKRKPKEIVAEELPAAVIPQVKTK